MEKIQLNNLGNRPMSVDENLWIYNALDCAVTSAVWEELKHNADKEPAKTSWDFVSAMRAPALTMMQRGILVQRTERLTERHRLERKRDKAQQLLDKLSMELLDSEMNAGSSKQVQHLFYTVLRQPVNHKYARGKKTVSCDRDALEKINPYHVSVVFVKLILHIRDFEKQIGVLQCKIDSDDRMRTSFNITGTETGRWSSSENAFHSGTNFQNITDKLRRPFVADEGYKLAYIDLDQAESRLVAYLSGDVNYIDALRVRRFAHNCLQYGLDRASLEAFNRRRCYKLQQERDSR